MLDNVILAILIAGAMVMLIVHVGYRKMQQVMSRDASCAEKLGQKFGSIKILSPVVYHGGLPDHPKPSRLQLALVDNGLLLFDGCGYHIVIDRLDCRAFDFFTIRQQSRNVLKSAVLFGPFTNMLFKDKLRHMISINYLDINREDNNLLLSVEEQAKHHELRSAILNLQALHKIRQCPEEARIKDGG
jgi:hypothetical protein